MTPRDERHRRGAALLLVLATIVLVVPPCLALARSAGTATLEKKLRADSRLADDLVRGAEVVATDWLQHESGNVVLPPDSQVPAVAILDEHFELDGKPVALRVVAWDECGLVPVALVGAASPLRLALPDEIARQADLLARAAEPRGLDQLVDGRTLTSVFPVVDIVRTRDGGTSLRVAANDSTTRSAGAWLGLRPTGATAINVHTVPKTVLDAAFRDAGRGGLEAVLAARAEHRKAAIAPPPPKNSSDTARHVDLVGTSDTWAFRVDVKVGSVRQSWWLVYVNQGGSWRRAQRLFISD